MLFLAFAIIAVALTIMSFIYKNVALSIISALAWTGMGIYQLSSYYGGGGVLLKYITGYLGFLMAVCMFIAPIMFVRKAKTPKIERDFYDTEFKDDFKEISDAYDARRQVKKYRGR
jgi:hypothetical protein